MEIKTAIVVDDEQEVTQVFSELLELQDLQILGVGHTGIDAIHLFNEHKPDIVFLDVHMPGLS